MTSFKRRILDLIPRPLQPPVWRGVRLLTTGLPTFRRELYFEIAERREFFRRAFKALSFNEIEGDYLEFGCWSAMTFGLAYHESRRTKVVRKMWAFDSFEGLPDPEAEADNHPKWQPESRRDGQAPPRAPFAMSVDDFHRRCWLQGIPRSAYETVIGYYRDSLRSGSCNLPSDICMAYIDCDLYSSTREVLRFLLPRLKHGMIIACDDYYCWSSTQPAGERRAVAESLHEHPEWRLLPYLQFGWHGMSFVVERRDQFESSGAWR